MGKYLLLFILLNISINAKAQDCNTLNYFTKFHEIQIGEKFPDALKRYFRKDTIGGVKSYHLWVAMTNFDEYKRFKTWFNFGSDFAHIYIKCLQNEQVFGIDFRQEFKEDYPIIISNKKYPTFYKNVLNEIELLFGKPLLKDEKFISKGVTFFYSSWDCDKMTISASFSYEGKEADCMINLVNNEMEKTSKLEKYTN